MIHRPHLGQRVELHYRGPRRKGAPSVRDYTGLHLSRGVVVVAGTGRGPINALVELEDGRRVVVVCSVPSSMEARLFSVEDDVIEAGLDKLIAVADDEEVQSGERS